MALRKQEKTLVYGEWTVIENDNEDLFIYERQDDSFELIIIMNHSDNKHEHKTILDGYNFLIGNYKSPLSDILLPWEARIYKKEK